MLLKEEDELIAWIQQRAAASGLIKAAELAERLCDEHRLRPESSELSRICPHLRKILVPLNVVSAVRELDDKTRILVSLRGPDAVGVQGGMSMRRILQKRMHVPPTFSEIRQIL